MADLTATLIALPEEELTSLITRVSLARETKALHSRLPKILTPFAFNLRIARPAENVMVEQDGGANYCYCAVDRRTVAISVSLPNCSSDPSYPSVSSESQLEEPEMNDTTPVQKEIIVQWGKWKTASRYLSGFAESENYFVSLRYGKPLNQARYDHSNAQEHRRMLARRKSAIGLASSSILPR
jgi:hypothetical protein